MIATPTLVIEHVTTADMQDGQPLPPFIDRGVIWHGVRRAGGRTLWRRILLAETHTHAVPRVRRLQPTEGTRGAFARDRAAALTTAIFQIQATAPEGEQRRYVEAYVRDELEDVARAAAGLRDGGGDA